MVEKFVKIWYNTFACDRQIGIDRAEREGCLLPERQEDGSRRKQKIIFYMKGWLQNVKTKYL